MKKCKFACTSFTAKAVLPRVTTTIFSFTPFPISQQQSSRGKHISQSGIITLTILALCFFSGCAPVQDKPQTKFYWPMDTDKRKVSGKWLEKRGKYKRHLGVDLSAPVGQKVRAVTDGTVYGVSRNGWGRGNIAILVKHKLDDGDWFIALYGHLNRSSSKIKKGAPVAAGETIGKVGRYWRGSHLHFAVAAPGKIPGPKYAGTKRRRYNFIDPVAFVDERLQPLHHGPQLIEPIYPVLLPEPPAKSKPGPAQAATPHQPDECKDRQKRQNGQQPFLTDQPAQNHLAPRHGLVGYA